jgi:hypothetical protein
LFQDGEFGLNGRAGLGHQFLAQRFLHVAAQLFEFDSSTAMIWRSSSSVNFSRRIGPTVDGASWTAFSRTIGATSSA